MGDGHGARRRLVTESRTVLLDNEAVQALRAVAHPKYRRVMAHVEATVGRRRREEPGRVLVPTAVRVEAGWSRTDPTASLLNRLCPADDALDTATANVAARIVGRIGIGVADAHLGAAAQHLPGQVIVLTSDPDDLRRAAEPKRITPIRI